MRGKTKFLIVFFIMIINCLTAIGYSTYLDTGAGKNGNDYERGIGIFNTAMTSESYAIKSVSGALGNPLVADLNNDSVNEIIVHTANSISLYHGSSLSIVDSVITSSAIASNVVVNDIDASHFPSIIFASADKKIHFYKYNGTNFYEANSFSFTAGAYTNGEIRIACEDVEKCTMLFANKIDNNANGNMVLYGYGFNMTQTGSVFTIAQSSTIGNSGSDKYNWCFSQPFSVPYENDTSQAVGTRYYFNILLYNGGGAYHEYIFTEIFGVNSSLSLVEGNSFYTDVGERLTANNPSCAAKDTGYSRYPYEVFSSPLVFDADESPSNGNEIIFGHATAADTFKLTAYKNTGTDLSDYPASTTADGIILSNPFRAYVFNQGTPSQKNNLDSEFCIAGFQQTLQRVEIICGSLILTPTSYPFLNNLEFFYTINGTFNVSQQYGAINNNIVHSVDESSTSLEGNNYNEFLTPYGVFQITRNSCSGSNHCGFTGICDGGFVYSSGYCEMQLIWQPRVSVIDASVISVDATKKDIGHEDIIALTTGNLFYFSDGYTNQPASIYSINSVPCILDYTINTNATPNIYITIHNAESFDSVQANVIMYKGDTNQYETGWTTLTPLDVNNNAIIPINVFANKSVTGGIIEVQARDNANPSNIDMRDFSFSVSDFVGATSATCIKDFKPSSSGSNVTAFNFTMGANTGNNAISKGLSGVDTSLNLELGVTILYIACMIIAEFLVIWGAASIVMHNPVSGVNMLQVISVVSLIVQGLALIIGGLIKVLDTGLIMFIAIILICCVILSFRKQVMPTGG